MGNLTTFTVYNDHCDEIPKNAQEFADMIYEACQSHKVKTLPIGQTICQKTRHANDKTFFAHAGNTVVEINYFAQDTIEMMKTNPEFFKEILDDMAYHVKELRKEYKQKYKPEKVNWKQEKLSKGETFITSEKGNSMSPLIKSGQDHRLTPIKLEDVRVNNIVFCKVNGRYYTHLVKGISNRGLLIGNNKGGINGWTKHVYGIVTEIL